MELTSIQTVLITLSVVLPGFITASLFRLIVPAKELSDQRGILSYLAFSAVNYALFGWIIWLALQGGFPQRNVTIGIILLVFVFLIGPLFLGLLFGFVWQRNLHRRMAATIGIRIVHPIPNSWDYMFGSVTEVSWILVTLADDRQVAGYFGTKSFASSDTNERDIFIEQVYKIGSDGTWQKDDNGKGVWLPQREIKLVTLWQERPNPKE
jgi:hypothetical protein